MGVALRDILTECKKTVVLEELAGTAAIDGNNALYQFLSIIRQPDGTPLMDSEGRITSHLSGLFFRLSKMQESGIRPVFIFDGPPPDFKKETVEERREVRRKAGEAWGRAREAGDLEEAYRQARSSSRIDDAIISSSKELLSLMGIPLVDAPSEGEAQGAVMAKRGDVSYAVSQDYDSLLFGAPLLVRNLTVSGKRKIRGRSVSVNPERIILSEFLDMHGITQENLIQMAVLIGTDFNRGIKGVGAKTALKTVKNGRFREYVEGKMPGFDPDPIISFFLSPPADSGYDLSWNSPDIAGISEMLCERYEFSPERIQPVLERMESSLGQARLDKWF